MNGKIALAVNPMSGRDVRRLAARATNMTHEAKRDIVARVVSGADAMGVSDIYITKEPFQISTGAVEQMRLRARLHVIDHPLCNGAADTERSMAAFTEAGCNTIVSLGGDGTNRAIVRANPDVDLIPLSTGTNNVFPMQVEPTIAGMVAALNANGQLAPAPQLKQRVKVLRVKTLRGTDVGLIDAVLLINDHVGNLLPFDATRLRRVMLARAEPDAIGMSPIGGLIEPVYAGENAGLLVDVGPGGQPVLVPVSPGLFATVPIRAKRRLAIDEAVTFAGPGVLALDGDRDIKIDPGEPVTVTLRRDGPFVIDIEAAMRWAVSQGIMAPDFD